MAERHVARPAVRPARGTLRVPGDKSISHRSVLFAAMAEGVSHLEGVLDSEDVRATIGAVRALGAEVTEETPDEAGLRLVVRGWGRRGPVGPAAPIDCGNSGTTARILLGVLAGWPLSATLHGDESLSRRPMARVTGPLEAMGATFRSNDGRLPITVHGGDLSPLAFESPVASAQVKTAVLLAGLRAQGRTSVREPALSRDHTERLLPAFGVAVGQELDECIAWVDGPAVPAASDVRVPGDPSSAAFLHGAALLTGGAVTTAGISLNPTRTGYLQVLRRMGALVEVAELPSAGAEPIGDVTVSAPTLLHATIVAPAEVPALVDEVPLLAVVAARAEGTTRFEGIGELRVKESDRLDAIADALRAFGVIVRTGESWLEVDGAADFRGGATLDSRGDHRLAMSYAVAALAADSAVTIERFEAVAVSYPGFQAHLESLQQA